MPTYSDLAMMKFVCSQKGQPGAGAEQINPSAPLSRCPGQHEPTLLAVGLRAAALGFVCGCCPVLSSALGFPHLFVVPRLWKARLSLLEGLGCVEGTLQFQGLGANTV